MHMDCQYLLICLLIFEVKIFGCTKFYESVGKRFTPTTGSSIKQVPLKRRSQDCLVECFQQNLCKSFNVFKEDGTGKLLCVMYDTTIGSFTNNHKFTYYSEEEEQVIPKPSSNPATTEIPGKTCKGNETVEVNRDFRVSLNDTRCLRIKNGADEIKLTWRDNLINCRKIKFADYMQIITTFNFTDFCIHATQNNFICLQTPNNYCQKFILKPCGLFRQIKVRNEDKCIGFNDEREIPSVNCNENLVYNITWL